MRILLADDNIAILNVLCEVLMGSGHKVQTFNNGKHALAAFLTTPTAFELIITDIKMPELDGLSLSKEIRRHNTTIPIILISGFSQLHDLAEIEFLNAHYLRKPLNCEALDNLINKLQEESSQSSSPLV